MKKEPLFALTALSVLIVVWGAVTMRVWERQPCGSCEFDLDDALDDGGGATDDGGDGGDDGDDGFVGDDDRVELGGVLEALLAGNAAQAGARLLG